MKAIVLAAGLGRRLRPITDLLPKALLPIGGRPVLEIVLDGLRDAGIGEVAIVTGHLGEQVRAFVGSGTFGVEVTYFEQTEQRGSADAVACARRFVDDTVMVVAADTGFSSSHIKGLADFHRDRMPDVSLCLKRLSRDRLRQGSTVKMEAGGRVADIIEKPDAGAELSDLAAALLHIYPPVLKDYLTDLQSSERGEYELPTIIRKMIEDGSTVLGREFDEAPHLTDLKDLMRLNFEYAAALIR